MILFQIGVNMANAGLAAIVFSINPIFVMIFSYFIVHEAFTRKKAITIILSLVGLVIVANPVAIIESGNVGLLVSLASAVSFALYTTLGKLRIAKLGGNVEMLSVFSLGVSSCSSSCYSMAIPFLVVSIAILFGRFYIVPLSLQVLVIFAS